MQISHDFIMRMLGSQGIQPPMLKSEVDNFVFTSIVSTTGTHQRMIDVSRCNLIPPGSFNRLRICQSLQYLDLSYTSFSDLSILVGNCMVLKSLQVCGLQLSSYEQLKFLDTLEILNLRSSSISSTEPLKDLILLRSLDLGHTKIRDINPLAGLTRLEELCLDVCTELAEVDPDSLIEFLENFRELKYINLAESINTSHDLHEQILSLCEDDICVDSKSKRISFFEAIIKDNAKIVQKLCEEGVDVNLKADAWAEKLLVTEWASRCAKKKINNPFFLCSHAGIEKSLRPSAIQVALYFNNQSVVKVLIEMGADLDQRVWMSDVQLDAGIAVPDLEKVKKKHLQPIQIFTTRELLHEMCDRRVHRIATNLMAKKITKWEIVCLQIKAELIEILESDWLKVKKKGQGGHGVEQAPPSVDGDTRSATAGGSLDAHAIFADTGDQSVETDANKVEAVDKHMIDGADAEHEEDARDASQLAEKKVKKKRVVDMSLAPRQKRRDWKDAMMVAKLIGPPLMVPSSITGHMIPLLGKRFYWLESRSRVLREKSAQQEAEHARRLEEMQGRWQEALMEKSAATADAATDDDGKAGTAVTPKKTLSWIDPNERKPKSLYDYPNIAHDYVPEAEPPPARLLLPPLEERKQEFLDMLQQRREEEEAVLQGAADQTTVSSNRSSIRPGKR